MRIMDYGLPYAAQRAAYPISSVTNKTQLTKATMGGTSRGDVSLIRANGSDSVKTEKNRLPSSQLAFECG
jgi:hypothetical protein